jgi:folate-dependent phosphoribosylglycinamide formyltransferase PurN
LCLQMNLTGVFSLQRRIDKLARRYMQEKEELKQLRRSAREAERLLQAQPETPAAVSAQQQAELDVKSARILELERTLFETYRAPAREATDAEAAEYVENLKKEVVHLTGMVRTVSGGWFACLRLLDSPPALLP